jgi:hypothetical protein
MALNQGGVVRLCEAYPLYRHQKKLCYDNLDVTTSRQRSARTPRPRTGFPTRLERARGGIEYTDPLGAHPRLTDAVRAEFEERRVLGGDDDASAVPFEERTTPTRHRVATDGGGP